MDESRVGGGGAPGSDRLGIALVACVVVCVDVLAFFSLVSLAGYSLASAHCASYALAWLAGGTAALGVSNAARPRILWALAPLGLLLRGGVLAQGVAAGWAPLPALLASQVFLLGVVAAILALVRRSPSTGLASRRDDAPIWDTRTASIAAIVYLLALRVSYLGAPQLIAQEAYYWNYSQHLDWSYLDHPPMVAWLIGASTFLGGHGELAVRAPALLCWLVAAWFVYHFARDVGGQRTALPSLLLFSVMPFFFGMGFIITPDSPLVACWAAALFFLHRALVGGERRAWLGAALAFGLGSLSKYSIALLGPAALVFALSDANARRWLARPAPYAAVLVAILLFSPVLLWNADHGWASFQFQGPSRFAEPIRSPLRPENWSHWAASLFQLVAATGIVPLAMVVAAWKPIGRNAFTSRRFMLLCALLPGSIFAFYALRLEPRPNWMGPAWMALLPVFAASMFPLELPQAAWARRATRVSWSFVAVAMISYAAAFHWLVLGLPGLQLPASAIRLVAWRDVGATISHVECEIYKQTGRVPLVVGADKYNESSFLAYYQGDDAGDASEPNGCPTSASRDISARHLFGRNSLMYVFWSDAAKQAGRDAIIVSRYRQRLENPEIIPYFERLEPIQPVPIRGGKLAVQSYWYRIGRGYRIPGGRSEPVGAIWRPRPPR